MQICLQREYCVKNSNSFLKKGNELKTIHMGDSSTEHYDFNVEHQIDKISKK